MCLVPDRFTKFITILIVASIFVLLEDIPHASSEYSINSCDANPSACYQPSVVYGNDDRTDVPDYQGDPYWIDMATSSVVALIDERDGYITVSENLVFLDPNPTLGQSENLCSDERFINQPVPAFCSGVLIDDDLVLTAGQCVRTHEDCRRTTLIFQYQMGNLNNYGIITITLDDVFSCQEIVVTEYSPTIDYTILRLDRPATPPHTPADIVGTDALPVPNDTPLVVIGTPSGIPFKIEDGGAVRDNREGVLDYFVANNDAFGGNSGSGVWNMDTKEIVGVLVRGDFDYVFDGVCFRVNYCSDSGCTGEESTYAFHAVEALCNTIPTSRVCGDGDDFDGDGIPDGSDNCPETFNPEQEDTYPPPSGNNCGDACECEGNFDDDQDQDGSDAATFKVDFGRSAFLNPCSNSIPCNGDFDCDGDVDGTDAAKFKEDFGRSPFSNPCSICPTDPWCNYTPLCDESGTTSCITRMECGGITCCCCTISGACMSETNCLDMSGSCN